MIPGSQPGLFRRAVDGFVEIVRQMRLTPYGRSEMFAGVLRAVIFVAVAVSPWRWLRVVVALGVAYDVFVIRWLAFGPWRRK